MPRLVLIGAIVAALSSIVVWSPLKQLGQPAANQALDFYKLSFQWPPSTCAKMTCIRPFKDQFTIHGLWPQYFPDNEVPPWAQNHGCTNAANPVDPNVFMNQIQAGTKIQLTAQWPNLREYTSASVNEIFWRQEWRKHGMCSTWPTQPDAYFNAALQLKSALEPNGVTIREVLADAGITPNGASYQAGAIAAALTNRFNIIPEISCNKANNVIQLWEIRFCYNKNPNQQPLALRNCPTPFSNYGCRRQTQIMFPPP